MDKMSKKDYAQLPVTKGQEIEMRIDDLAYGGDSVGRYKNLTIFVPYGVPGSVVRVQITDVKRNFAMGRILRSVIDSPIYVKPECPFFGRCGGCDWMNIKYSSQAEHKVKFIKFMLDKTSGLTEVNVSPIIKYENPLYYRNRAQYKLTMQGHELQMGFYKARSHEVIGVDKCLLLHPKINEAAALIKTALNKNKKDIYIYNEEEGRGYLRHIAVRVNLQGDCLITFVTAGKEIKPYLREAAEFLRSNLPGLKGIVQNINSEPGNQIFGDYEKVIYGVPNIIEKAAGVDFELDSGSFFQVNATMLEKMAAFVRENTKKGAMVLDLYGGVGALTLPSRDKFKEIFVVEIDNKASQKLNSMVNSKKIDNVRVINGKAEEMVDKVINDFGIDTVIIDPPRKGIHPRIISVLNRSKIDTLIYISCNPASFARDIKELKENYYLREAVPLDQFAQTYHVEIMAKLERKTGIKPGTENKKGNMKEKH
jgi:23S rRNA (uracil1939-C5)-methyltransferase